MKALHDGILDVERYRLEAALGARLAVLFGRCPELCGFMVGERLVAVDDCDAGSAELELFVAGIDVYPALSSLQSETLVAHISAALADLLNDSPAAAELLVGRTFARNLH